MKHKKFIDENMTVTMDTSKKCMIIEKKNDS